VSVFNPEMTALRFSSHLPGCTDARLAAGTDVLVVVSRTTGADTSDPTTNTPVIGVGQPFAGGTDGHVLLLRNPVQ
jgi:hypothetical protein